MFIGFEKDTNSLHMVGLDSKGPLLSLGKSSRLARGPYSMHSSHPTNSHWALAASFIVSRKRIRCTRAQHHITFEL